MVMMVMMIMMIDDDDDDDDGDSYNNNIKINNLTCLIVPRSPGTCSSGVQADMVFVLDASGSVGSSNFQTMLSFVQDLVNDFDIGSNAVLNPYKPPL